jgi:hypothetical protein
MNNENRFWQIIIILVGLITAFVPAYVSYDLYGGGELPERKIELNKMPVIDPLSDLSGIGDTVSLQIRSQTESIDNIVIAKAYLKNVGRTPILPSDYYEKISVNVKKPWKILAVGSDDLIRDIEFKWNRVSDEQFEAVPALLNPGDMVSTNVYITNTEHRKLQTHEKGAKPEVEWRARIVNMTAFTYPPDVFSQLGNYRWGVIVDLSGWAVPFMIGAAMLFLALYLHLLSGTSLLRGMRVTAIITVLGASFLSFAAAESMATYLFGNTRSALFGIGVDHWMNAPWIILHAGGLLVILYLKRKHRIQMS